jgi:hypothetical protein
VAVGTLVNRFHFGAILFDGFEMEKLDGDVQGLLEANKRVSSVLQDSRRRDMTVSFMEFSRV